jgi:hypothetical protein
MPADLARRDGDAVSTPAVVAHQYRDDLVLVGFVAMLKKDLGMLRGCSTGTVSTSVDHPEGDP